MISLLKLKNRRLYLPLLNKIFVLLWCAFAITACSNIAHYQKPKIDLNSEFRMYSKEIKDSFYISVQVPLEYNEQSKMRYPVVVLTDGNFYTPMLGPILHQYEKGGLLPPLILVSIGYKTFRQMDSLRVRDYLFPASIPSDEMKAIGGGRKFYHFMTQEVLPKIDLSYRSDTNKRTLLGHSFGGYFSLLALSEQVGNKRNDFAGFVAASPTLWYNDFYLSRLPKELNKPSIKDTLNIFLSVGEKEEPKWSVQPVKDFTKQLSDTHIKNVKYDLEIYSHLDHMDVGIISFIRGLEIIYNNKQK